MAIKGINKKYQTMTNLHTISEKKRNVNSTSNKKNNINEILSTYHFKIQAKAYYERFVPKERNVSSVPKSKKH
jgi:hypothetical protein